MVSQFALAGLLALLVNTTLLAQPRTINVKTGHRYDFNVALRSVMGVGFDAADSTRIDARRTSALAGVFMLKAQRMWPDSIDWEHAVAFVEGRAVADLGRSSHRDMVVRSGNIRSGYDGAVTAGTHYEGAWGDDFASVLESIGFSERHFQQLFLLQGAFAAHSAGETWERRRDGVSADSGRTIDQHYTVHFQHDGAVDTLARHTIRIRFRFDVDSIVTTTSGPVSRASRTLRGRRAGAASRTPAEMSPVHRSAVRGVITGTVYYSLDDGLVVAFRSEHSMSGMFSTSMGGKPATPEQSGITRQNGTLEIARRN